MTFTISCDRCGGTISNALLATRDRYKKFTAKLPDDASKRSYNTFEISIEFRGDFCQECLKKAMDYLKKSDE